MYKCKYCGIKSENCKVISGHTTQCKKNPNREKNIKNRSIGQTKKRIKIQIICEKCGKRFEQIIKENSSSNYIKKFCSLKCANGHVHDEKWKKNISNGVKNSEKFKIGNEKRYSITKRHLITKICKFCNKKFSYKKNNHSKNRISCNNCVGKRISEINKGKCGGYRKGSGRGKHGWYKGYWCDSSWELAYVIYNLEHDVKFERNTEKFEYFFDDKKYNYIPDFNDGCRYIEIKGYWDEKNQEKIKQFPKKILIVGKKEIKPYLKYVVDKYGRNFINLYEKSAHVHDAVF